MSTQMAVGGFDNIEDGMLGNTLKGGAGRW